MRYHDRDEGWNEPSVWRIDLRYGLQQRGPKSCGRRAQYGGFGFLYGDGYAGGSGFATLAFRAVIRAWDERGPATLLTSLVLGQLGYTSVEPMYEDVLYGKTKVPPSLVKTLFQALKQVTR